MISMSVGKWAACLFLRGTSFLGGFLKGTPKGQRSDSYEPGRPILGVLSASRHFGAHAFRPSTFPPPLFLRGSWKTRIHGRRSRCFSDDPLQKENSRRYRFLSGGPWWMLRCYQRDLMARRFHFWKPNPGFHRIGTLSCFLILKRVPLSNKSLNGRHPLQAWVERQHLQCPPPRSNTEMGRAWVHGENTSPEAGPKLDFSG